MMQLRVTLPSRGGSAAASFGVSGSFGSGAAFPCVGRRGVNRGGGGVAVVDVVEDGTARVAPPGVCLDIGRLGAAGADWGADSGEDICDVLGSARQLNLPPEGGKPMLVIGPLSIGGAMPVGGARTGAARTDEVGWETGGGGIGGGVIVGMAGSAIGGAIVGTVHGTVRGAVGGAVGGAGGRVVGGAGGGWGGAIVGGTTSDGGFVDAS